MAGNSGAGLSAIGVDFHNETAAAAFLEELLDDTTLQVVANRYARYFWYTISVAIGIATFWRFLSTAMLRSRYCSTRMFKSMIFSLMR